jgi:hypothetical protein
MAYPEGQYHREPLATREGVAFCHSDKVLRLVFVPGEWLAAPIRRPGRAVGLRGEPTSRGWFRLPTTVSDHKYWKSEASGRLVSNVLASANSGRRVARRDPAHREVDVRDLPERP